MRSGRISRPCKRTKQSETQHPSTLKNPLRGGVARSDGVGVPSTAANQLKIIIVNGEYLS
jgi:hypothetical protein